MKRAKIDLRPFFRKHLLKYYGEAAALAFDHAQEPTQDQPQQDVRCNLNEQ